MQGKTSRLAGAVAVLAIALGGCSASTIKFAPAGAPLVTASLAPKPATRGDEQKMAALPADASADIAAKDDVDDLISQYAMMYAVPEDLVRRVVHKESKFNPEARNGPYMGLMQIRTDTARSMGYDGNSSGLLDAETNLQYGVKYLRGAYLSADKNPDQAMRLYASGYYYHAKRKGLLEEVGLR